DARFCTVFMFVYFCFCHPPTLYSYTLSLHDALPISSRSAVTDHGETSTPEWRTNTGPRSRQRSIVITPAIPQKMRANGHDEELAGLLGRVGLDPPPKGIIMPPRFPNVPQQGGGAVQGDHGYNGPEDARVPEHGIV